jgi:hypothetical protein
MVKKLHNIAHEEIDFKHNAINDIGLFYVHFHYTKTMIDISTGLSGETLNGSVFNWLGIPHTCRWVGHH